MRRWRSGSRTGPLDGPVGGPTSALVTALVTVLAAGLVAGAPAAAAPPVPVLVAVRAAHHPGRDRVVFEFRGGLPAHRDVAWVSRLSADASGLPVVVPGRAVLRVRFSSAQAHDDAGRATTPGRLALGLPEAVSLVRAGDVEGVLTHGLGVERRTSAQVTTLRHPDRVVVDVGARFRTTTARVWFVDDRRAAAGHEPVVAAVRRVVPAGAPATAVLDHLFAGPTPAERARGLRLVASGATGWRGLQVRAGTARVQLTGGCASGGSTTTVGSELLPALHQFPAVRRVVVLDPRGRTERPAGRGDSLPECLEP